MDIMGHAEEDFGENGMLLSNIWVRLYKENNQ